MSKPIAPAAGRPPRTVRRTFRFRRFLLVALLVLGGLVAAAITVPTTRWAEGSGYVMTDKELEIRSPVEGSVRDIRARSGAHVTQGDLLIQLDDAVHRAALEKAATELEGAKARLDSRRISQDLERASREEQKKRAKKKLQLAQDHLEKMLKSGGLGFSQKEKDDAQLTADLAQSQLAELSLPREQLWEKEIEVLQEQIEEARKTVHLHQAEVALRRITAGIAGTMQFNRFEPGQVVKNTFVIGQIFDENAWVVKIKLGERHLPHVSLGQAVEIELAAYPPLRFGRFEGTVSRIYPVVSPQATGDGIFSIEVSFQKPPDLPLSPGMRARARAHTGRTTWMYRLLGW